MRLSLILLATLLVLAPALANPKIYVNGNSVADTSCSSPSPEPALGGERPSGGNRSGVPESWVGPYRILEELEPAPHGARRLLAEDPGGEEVVLSLAPPEAGGLGWERYERRARRLAGLDSPHLVQVKAWTRDYLVLEPTRPVRLQALPPERRLDLFAQLLEGLACAHRAGLVHTELRPACLHQGPEGKLRLDFSPVLQAGAGDLLETLPYLAPEQAQAGFVDDPRVDVYALGALLFELLTGRPPFQGDTPLELIERILHDPVPSVLALAPAWPLALDRLIRQALHKDPEGRFQTLQEMSEELALARTTVSLDAPPPPPVAPEARPFRPFFQSLGQPRVASADWLCEEEDDMLPPGDN